LKRGEINEATGSVNWVKKRRCVIERGKVMLDSGSRDKKMKRKNRVKISKR
jgi:hypothetical protein